MAVMISSKEKFQKAVTRANAEGTVRNVQDLGGDKYSVLSSDGVTFYRVTVLFGGAGYICECPAGRNSVPCKHAGAIWLRRAVQPPTVAGTPAGRGATAGESAKTFLWGE